MIDAMSTVFSVIALIMQVARYAEQWLLWIIVNIVSVIMWILLIGKDSSAVTMVVMWIAYLFNSYMDITTGKLAMKNSKHH